MNLVYNIDNETNGTPMSGADSFNYILGGSLMNYKCNYAINFDGEKKMTVTFTVWQQMARGVSALKDFFTVWENTPEGEATSCDDETFPTITLAVRAVKARLLVQYGITEDRIIFSGIEID